jgi:dienelactone hydrolase
MHGFTEFPFPHEGITHQVFRTGRGPAVLVLHELAGLSPNAADLGRRIADAGFTAHLPLFFGRPYQGSATRGAMQLFCIRREFTLLALGQTSPVANWLRALCQFVHREADGPGVGVIGMCFTGGLALAMLIEPTVRAAISSQPSLPLAISRSARANLGLSPEDLRRAKDSNTPLLALRFKHDLICPRARLDAIKAAFPSATAHNVPERGGYRDVKPPIPLLAHSILTGNFVDKEGHPTRTAMNEVIQFLTTHLIRSND